MTAPATLESPTVLVNACGPCGPHRQTAGRPLLYAQTPDGGSGRPGDDDGRGGRPAQRAPWQRVVAALVALVDLDELSAWRALMTRAWAIASEHCDNDPVTEALGQLAWSHAMNPDDEAVLAALAPTRAALGAVDAWSVALGHLVDARLEGWAEVPPDVVGRELVFVLAAEVALREELGLGEAEERVAREIEAGLANHLAHFRKAAHSGRDGGAR